MKKIVEVEVGEYCEECNIRAYINKWHSCPIAPSYKRMDYENQQGIVINFMNFKLDKFEKFCTKEDIEIIKKIIKKEYYTKPKCYLEDTKLH